MRTSLFLAAAMLSTGLAAHAATIDNFTVVSGTTTIRFSIPLPASAANSFSFDSTFLAPLTVNGIAADSSSSEEDFGTQDSPPSLQLSYSVAGTSFFLQENGPQLFTGATQNPIFNLGKTVFTGGTVTTAFSSSGLAAGDTLTVTQTTTAVTPEPSSIALLGTGLLGTAGVLKRRLVRACSE